MKNQPASVVVQGHSDRVASRQVMQRVAQSAFVVRASAGGCYGTNGKGTNVLTWHNIPTLVRAAAVECALYKNQGTVKTTVKGYRGHLPFPISPPHPTPPRRCVAGGSFPGCLPCEQR